MRRSGFTLVELLVVVGILLVLATTTVMLINTSLDAERGRGASRTLQSALAGARDRAVHTSKIPQGPRNVGLRLLIENPLGVDNRPGQAGVDDDADGVTDNRPEVGTPGTDDEYWVTRMMYVEQIPPYTTGTVDMADDPGTAAVEYVWANGTGTDWASLYRKGLLVNGSTVRIPDDPTGLLYTIDTRFLGQTPPVERLVLTTPVPSALTAVPYRLDIEPAVAPNTEPIELSQNIVIDLWRSGLPDLLEIRIDRIDIMFTPSARLAGPLQSMGFAHFVLRDMEDMEIQRSLATAQREQFIVSVNGSTGRIETSRVNQTDADNDGAADDPFSFALTGEPAGQ